MELFWETNIYSTVVNFYSTDRYNYWGQYKFYFQMASSTAWDHIWGSRPRQLLQYQKLRRRCMT